MDIQINPDMTVYEMAQLSTIPGVSLSLEDDVIIAASAFATDPQGKRYQVPVGRNINIGRPTGIRLMCDRFPQHTTIKLILASVALNYAPPGSPATKELYAAKRLPNFVLFRGHYRVFGRVRSIEDRIEFAANKT
jgi:hypothetical protein